MAQKYQHYDTGDDSHLTLYGTWWGGQSFTPEVAHTITSVKLFLFRTGNPGTLTVSIRATDGAGLPTGGDLTSGTTFTITLPTGAPYEWREIFLTPYDLEADVKYAIIFKVPSGNAANALQVRRDFADSPYIRGETLFSADSGVGWAGDGTRDNLFEEWGEPIVPPAPPEINYGEMTMAKVTAPLFSFGARGKLANSLVYFPWKGIDCVRSYVVPANPRTTAQTTQRDRMDDAVDEWHDATYSADDVSAWNRFANVLAAIMSGFNAMVRTFINEAILGNTWETIHHVTTAIVQANNFDVLVEKLEGGNHPTVYWGTRQTHFPNSQGVGSDGVNIWRTTIAGLTKDTLYYFYFDVGTSATDYGRTGIYSQRTAPA